MNQYICLCCDGKKGPQTLHRVKPHKIYVCAGCLKERGGKQNVIDNVAMLMQKFRDRREEERRVTV